MVMLQDVTGFHPKHPPFSYVLSYQVTQGTETGVPAMSTEAKGKSKCNERPEVGSVRVESSRLGIRFAR